MCLISSYLSNIVYSSFVKCATLTVCLQSVDLSMSVIGQMLQTPPRLSERTRSQKSTLGWFTELLATAIGPLSVILFVRVSEAR